MSVPPVDLGDIQRHHEFHCCAYRHKALSLSSVVLCDICEYLPEWHFQCLSWRDGYSRWKANQHCVSDGIPIQYEYTLYKKQLKEAEKHVHSINA